MRWPSPACTKSRSWWPDEISPLPGEPARLAAESTAGTVATTPAETSNGHAARNGNGNGKRHRHRRGLAKRNGVAATNGNGHASRPRPLPRGPGPRRHRIERPFAHADVVFKTKTAGLTFQAAWLDPDKKTKHPALGPTRMPTATAT